MSYISFLVIVQDSTGREEKTYWRILEEDLWNSGRYHYFMNRTYQVYDMRQRSREEVQDFLDDYVAFGFRVVRARQVNRRSLFTVRVWV